MPRHKTITYTSGGRRRGVALSGAFTAEETAFARADLVSEDADFVDAVSLNA